MLLLLWSGVGHLETITDTDILQLPIDCVLAGQQPYRERITEYEIPAPNTKHKTTLSKSSVRQLGGGKPEFTTKSGSLNKSHK